MENGRWNFAKSKWIELKTVISLNLKKSFPWMKIRKTAVVLKCCCLKNYIKSSLSQENKIPLMIKGISNFVNKNI